MTRQFYGASARYLVIFTLLVGVVFHATRLVVGVDAFQSMFSATIDTLFSIPIVLGIVAMLYGMNAIDFHGNVRRGIGWFTLGYFAVSMPLHVQTWFTQDVSYIATFPWWYSIVFLSYTACLLWVWAQAKVGTVVTRPA